MKLFPLLALALLTSTAHAQNQSGQLTNEQCVTAGDAAAGASTWPPLTQSSAYTAGNLVGGLITLLKTMVTSRHPGAGVLQSISLNFKDAQTAEFDVYGFRANPSSSTWTDKATPSINAADVFKVRPPIKLTTAASGLGTHTSYGTDAVARAALNGSTTDYFAIVTTGTPTFASTTDAQFCAAYLQD